MTQFTSNTISISGTLYLRIPADTAREASIKEDQYFDAVLRPLVPKVEP